LVWVGCKEANVPEINIRGRMGYLHEYADKPQEAENEAKRCEDIAIKSGIKNKIDNNPKQVGKV